MDNKNNKFTDFTISKKIIIVLVTCMCISAFLWTSVMFVNMRRNAEATALESERTYISNLSSKANSVEEVCGLANEVVSQSSSINNYLKYVRYNKNIPTELQNQFYKVDYSMLYNMSDTNHYLYQVKLYVNGKIIEKNPIYYRMNKIQKMKWGKTFSSGQWQLNYVDKVSSNESNTPLAGFVTKINDSKDNLLAVLEISTKMEYIFPDIYQVSNDEWNCFITNSGEIYTASKNQGLLTKNKEQLLKYTKADKYFNTSFADKFNGEGCTISSCYMSDLQGTYIHIKSLNTTVSSYYTSQIPYILVVICSLIIITIILFLVVKKIFKRFDILIGEIARIKRKEYLVIPETGNDEITELSKEINSMLSAIEELNKEKINRQLLIKNTQIKSLQNQINAHFMYNVLETIKMMAEIKGEFDISDSITSLGEMFRYSMKWTSGMVGLNEEIHYIKNYLNLINLRFDYEIYLSLSIEEKYNELKIPKMSLQPLVENSVYHGIEDIAKDTTIYIKVFEKDDIINLEVSDAGAGMSNDKLKELTDSLNSTKEIDEDREHGRALYNVQQRLKMYFGTEYGMKIYSKEGAYTKVVLQIPKGENT